jgi:PTS system nitrogen regulatory IIA component
MRIAELLAPDSILLPDKEVTYHAALDLASVHLSYVSELRPQHIYDALMEREARGGTSMGSGVALPHARMEYLRRPQGVFLHLLHPVIPTTEGTGEIDLLFVLLAPIDADAAYLRAVGRIAKILRDPARAGALRSRDKSLIYITLLSEDEV